MKTKRIQRSGGVIAEGQQVVGVKKANLVSLCGKPANRKPFSMVRSDKEETDVSKVKPRITRTKRSESPVHAIVFPDTYTAETAAETLEGYGLASFVVEEVEGVIRARRSDLQSIADEGLEQIKLTGDGVVALVPAAENTSTGKDQLSMVSMEFNSEHFSRSDVVEWLEKNDVDFKEEDLDNSSGNFVLKRSEVEVGEGEEQRQVELEDGVVAHIVRSCNSLIPEGFAAVINETAYTGWGWGQLDFNARLADIEVGEKLREGMWQLREVIEDILFYSHLPIDLRKDLIARSMTQFSTFTGELLDKLPRQLLVSVSAQQRSEPAKEPTDMSKTQEEQTKALTREDVTSIVEEVLKRNAETAETATATAEETETVAASEEQQTATLTRADLTAAFSEAMKPVAERLEKLESTTVVRSDQEDPAATEVTDPVTEAHQKRSDDPFYGSLGSILKRQ